MLRSLKTGCQIYVLPGNHFPEKGKRVKYTDFIKEGQAVERLIPVSPQQKLSKPRGPHPYWNNYMVRRSHAVQRELTD